MKQKILLGILSCMLYIVGQAQGSLQFNQVLLLTTNSNNQSWTVPAGKVWKLSSASVTGGNSSYLALSLNGDSCWYTPYSTSDQGRFSLTFPTWLPAGTVLGLPYPQTVNRFVSVLEFNILP